MYAHHIGSVLDIPCDMEKYCNSNNFISVTFCKLEISHVPFNAINSVPTLSRDIGIYV